MFKGTTRLFH